ncbi:MAG: hypothetical protein K0V04_28940 [Deltaproteobacteria bacterium]|nr:hypothetical protein [Deltaproteobacteria bacterium]
MRVQAGGPPDALESASSPTVVDARPLDDDEVAAAPLELDAFVVTPLPVCGGTAEAVEDASVPVVRLSTDGGGRSVAHALEINASPRPYRPHPPLRCPIMPTRSRFGRYVAQLRLATSILPDQGP